MHSLDAIRERLRKARKDPQQFQVEEETGGFFRCPVCDDCPLCDTNLSITGRQWTYNNLAAGIQVFGIGEDLENLEDFAKNAPGDIQFLLEYIDMLTAKR